MNVRTLAAWLSAYLPATDWVVLVKDTAELQIDRPILVRFEAGASGPDSRPWRFAIYSVPPPTSRRRCSMRSRRSCQRTTASSSLRIRQSCKSTGRTSSASRPAVNSPASRPSRSATCAGRPFGIVPIASSSARCAAGKRSTCFRRSTPATPARSRPYTRIQPSRRSHDSRRASSRAASSCRTRQTGAGAALTVPVDAVLDSGAEQLVFVSQGEGHFTPRHVKVGRRVSGDIQILDGLKEGEAIATAAAFFLDSESQLRAGVGGYETAPASAAAGAPSADLRISLRTEPSPPTSGENVFVVAVKDRDGKPIADADVRLDPGTIPGTTLTSGARVPPPTGRTAACVPL